MKVRLSITLTILVIAASAMTAQERREAIVLRDKAARTVVIKDGKVISGDPAFVESLLPGKRGVVGVSVVDLTPELREHLGGTKNSGVLVGSLENGGPAEKAGIRVGDLIVAVDGTDVDSAADLRKVLREKKEGDAVRIDVLRGSKRQTIVTNVVEREGMTFLRSTNLDDLTRNLGETFNGPEWRARVERLQNCDELQHKLRELETRMKDLERKLQK